MKTKHHIKYAVMLLLAIVLAFISCQEDEKPEMVEISLNQSTLTMVLGTSETIEVSPDSENVEWTSTNKEVVNVNNGIITAVGLGDAIVNAKLGKSRAFCEISVIEEPIDVTGVSVNISDTILAVKGRANLSAIVSPDSATYKNVHWSSSNPGIVSVDDLTGEITALALGEATITVTAVDGGKTDTCIVNVWPSLLLNRPYNNITISLNPTDPSENTPFSWIPFEGTNEYVLKINVTDDFQSPVFEKEVSSGSTELSSFELNEIFKDITSLGPVKVYWTVHPKEPIDVIGEVRTLDILPDRHDYLKLLPESATNLTVSQDDGEYQYTLITGSGESFVTTSALSTALHPDSSMFSITYKSTNEIGGMKIFFIKADGTETGSISTSAISASSEWKEFSVSVKQILNDYAWGDIGDYLKLSFENTWQAEVNGLHFRGMNYQEIRDNYLPQIFSLVGNSSHTILEEISEYHYKIITTGGDPNVSTSKLEEDLPNGACILVFEYKSDQQLANNLQIFGGTPTQGLAESRSLKLGTVAAASEWTEYKVDMTPAIEGWGWGVAGSYMRLDTGERPDYEMEIRNIRIEFED